MAVSILGIQTLGPLKRNDGDKSNARNGPANI